MVEASRRRPVCELPEAVRDMDPLRAATAADALVVVAAAVDLDDAAGIPDVVEAVVVPTTRLEARKGRSAAEVVAASAVVVAVVGRVRTTRRAAPTPVVVVVEAVVATAADRVEVDADVVARGLIASFKAALPLSSLPAMVERVRLALVKSPSAALFRVPRTPEAAEAADALVEAVTVEAGLDGPASAAPPSIP